MRRWIVTFFGAGLIPQAPGTAGSLLATISLLLIQLIIPLQYWTLFLISSLLVACALAIGLAPWAITHFGRKDPQPFVLDEVAGICLTTLFQPMYGGWRWLVIFASFRLFDIIKPPPARQLEQLPAGWGILLDDLAAAVYANVVCQIVFRWVG